MKVMEVFFVLIYFIIFIISSIYLHSQTCKINGLKRIIVILGLIFFYIMCLRFGITVGDFAGNIWAKKNGVFDPGAGHALTMALESVTFIPGIISIYMWLYNKKKTGKLFTIIYMLETIIIVQMVFFLLII